MGFLSGNPLTVQGQLNRILTHVIVPAFPQLTTQASFMAKELAKLTFDGPFVQQIPTATGIVNSPEPYVMGQVVVNVLRSQSSSSFWIAQAQVQATLGTITIYPDSTVFPAITILDASIIDYDPGAFDGVNPAVAVTVKGTVPMNNTMWG